jgi:hypothetical protein
MSKREPNWPTCQIEGIVDYICRSAGSIHSLRILAAAFREAAAIVDNEIRRRELTNYHDDESEFG